MAESIAAVLERRADDPGRFEALAQLLDDPRNRIELDDYLEAAIRRESGDVAARMYARARFYAELVRREGPKLQSQGQLEALSTIKLELLNIYEAQDILQNRLTSDESAVPFLFPIARWLRKYLEMASAYREMLERHEALKEAAGRADSSQQVLLGALLGCGQGQYRLNAYEAARAELGAAKELAEALGDLHGIAASLNILGNVAVSQGNYSAAREQYAESLAILREIGDRPGIADSLNNLGIVESEQGNYSAARKLYAEALAIRRETGDRHSIAAFLNNLGVVESDQGNYGTARELYAEALAIRREVGDCSGIAISLDNLGIVESVQGNYCAGREVFAEALAIRREIGDRYGIAASLTNLGAVEFRQGNNGAARKFHGEALAIFREIGYRRRIALSLDNLGTVEFSQGNFSAARELHGEALAIQREIGDRSGIASILYNLGNVERMQGSHSAARELFAESLAIRRETGDRSGLCAGVAAAGCLLATVVQHQAATICLYGARYHAAQLGYTFEPLERELLEQGLASIEHPDTGLAVDERQRLMAQAETMSLDDLAQFAQDELEKLKDIVGAAEEQAGT